MAHGSAALRMYDDDLGKRRSCSPGRWRPSKTRRCRRSLRSPSTGLPGFIMATGSLGLDLYAFVKTLHVLSATVLFGTGAGIAFFMLQGHLSRVPAACRFAAGATVR